MEISLSRVVLSVVACVAVVSCTVATRQTVRADGTREQQLYAQLGGKGAYVGNADGSMVVQADHEKSFGQAVTAAGAAYAVGAWLSADKAATAAEAATAQNAARTSAATEQARIQATQRAATTLGSNPEANVGAINAAGNLFR